MTTRTAALIHLRLKGFVKPDGLDDDIRLLVDEGLVSEAKLGFRLSPEGRIVADAAWAEERAAADPEALEAVHAIFAEINSPFKALVADWQLRNGSPNDHSDAAYDAAILTRLRTVHVRLGECLVLASAQVIRLNRYAPAFSAALAKLELGEIRWMAAPIIDSYHTLWFELHEELIRLTGRTRATEAASGAGA